MDRTAIIESVEKVTERVNDRWSHIKFPTPTVQFFNKTAVAGRAIYSQHVVEFNEVLARDNSDRFNNTVIHEIAHLVTHIVYPRAKQSHGPEFRSVMAELGGQPNTYHSYNVTNVQLGTKKKYRYEVKCKCSTYWVTRNRMFSCDARRSTCKKCFTSPKSTGKHKVII